MPLSSTYASLNSSVNAVARDSSYLRSRRHHGPVARYYVHMNDEKCAACFSVAHREHALIGP
jgi:hypothetical protein